jgi:hypothetical protein
MHPVFAQEKLKPYHHHIFNQTGTPPNTLDSQNDEDYTEYEVEEILGHEIENDRDYWYVAWKGYGSENNSWEPDENVRDTAVTAQGVLGQRLRFRLPGLVLRRTSWVPGVEEDVGRGHGGGFCWVLLVSFGFRQSLFRKW